MADKGRPRSIPNRVFETIIMLRKQGLGYRRITTILRKEHGVDTTKGSVERFVKNQPPYDKARAEHFKKIVPSRHPPSEFRRNCNCQTCFNRQNNPRPRGSIVKVFDERDRRRHGIDPSSIRVRRWK